MSKSTPEGKIKELVKTMLKDIGCIPASKSQEVTPQHKGWYYMPVQNGMGVSSIPDFIINYQGYFFAAETKAFGKNATARQQFHIDAINLTSGYACVIDSETRVEQLKTILLGAAE
jgi:hypothetical protein